LAGEADLLGVDDDDELAGVHVRRVFGAVLAAQDVGDLDRQPADDLVGGIDQIPTLLHLSLPGHEGAGRHRCSRRDPGTFAKTLMIDRRNTPSRAGANSGVPLDCWQAERRWLDSALALLWSAAVSAALLSLFCKAEKAKTKAAETAALQSQ